MEQRSLSANSHRFCSALEPAIHQLPFCSRDRPRRLSMGTLPQIALPEPGQIVQVRQRPFVVVEAQASVLPDGATAPQHLVRLSSVEDDALGEELEVVWELE